MPLLFVRQRQIGQLSLDLGKKRFGFQLSVWQTLDPFHLARLAQIDFAHGTSLELKGKRGIHPAIAFSSWSSRAASR